MKNLQNRKKIILMLVLLISIMTTTFAQDSDYSKVEKTLSYYLDGSMMGDYEVIKKAFHADATMRNVSAKHGYRDFIALEVFKKAKKRTEPKPNKTYRITYIDISGNAASAKIEIASPSVTVTDYMQLLKINGEWKIVGKIYDVRRLEGSKQ
ncbi:nuclear transport factor 2 family protein [Aquimarina longa]|uniref:nuclear transport factor 2 family protein n=1 Tax=Aquimarina longa TaxID=1080221 RepID=UPI0007838E27|nr:nuclear transport factor 2 family protein [Aquimarina longa]